MVIVAQHCEDAKVHRFHNLNMVSFMSCEFYHNEKLQGVPAVAQREQWHRWSTGMQV